MMAFCKKKSNKEKAEDYAAQASERANEIAVKLAERSREAATAAIALAGAAGEKLAPVAQDAAHRVSDAAKEVSEKAKPYVDDAVSKARPYIEDASAKTDETVAKVREDYLPRAKRAANAAIDEARTGSGDLTDRAQDIVKVSKKELETPEKKKKGRGRKVLGFTAIVGALGAAVYVLYQRSKPAEDPWAESYWDDLTNDGKSGTSDASDGVAEATDDAAATASDAADTAAEAASDAADTAAEKASEFADTAAKSVNEFARETTDEPEKN